MIDGAKLSLLITMHLYSIIYIYDLLIDFLLAMDKG